MRAHRLVLMLHLQTDHLDSHLDASHLCGVKRCVNVAHLVFEDHATNKARQRCHGAGHCIHSLGHNPLPLF